MLLARASAGSRKSWKDVFTANFKALLDARSTLMPNSNNDTDVETFRTQHNCPTFTGWHRRYDTSLWCMAAVQDSYNDCPKTLPYRPLCRDTCLKQADAALDALRNATECPGLANNQAALAKKQEVLQAYCSQAAFVGEGGSCISGDEIEPGTCGYLRQQQICNPVLCSTASPKRCPGSIRNMTEETDGDAGAVLRQDEAAGGINLGAIIGGVAGALGVAGLAFWVYRRKRARALIASQADALESGKGVASDKHASRFKMTHAQDTCSLPSSSPPLPPYTP